MSSCMIIEIQEKLETPYVFSIRMWVVPMYTLWSSIAVSIFLYGIMYSPTILAGLCVKNTLYQMSLYIQ